MSQQHTWNADAMEGDAPPPLIGLPEFNLPMLNIDTGRQMSAFSGGMGPGGSAPSQHRQMLSPDDLDSLSMSGTITLGSGMRVGSQGIRGYETAPPGYGAPPLDMGAQPGVRLTQRDMDFLTSTGTLTVGSDTTHFQVGRAGIRGPAQEVADLKELQVTKQLGAGASAKVHLAQHTRTGKLYALKDIQVNLDKRALRELGTEIQISSTVESNHVVKCHNAFFAEGHMTLVLEYMDLGSLADVITQVGQISECYLADIARQALQGFYDLHMHRPNPIIHRDIKPSNLLVNRAGQLKISDFGVSRVLEDSNDVGTSLLTLDAGTYTYMSPERIEGKKYSFNTDIWAFGLSLLECAIGEFPYQPKMDYFTLLTAIKTRDAPKAPADEFSPEFCDFISCCLQKEPEQRSSAEHLLAHPFCKKYENTTLLDLLDMAF